MGLLEWDGAKNGTTFKGNSSRIDVNRLKLEKGMERAGKRILLPPLDNRLHPWDAGGMDHDQRFKTLIPEFFVEFLRLFFADWADRLDLSDPEWLEKELFPDPPEGKRHAIDLVARVTLKRPDGTTPSLLLVHIEIESPERTTDLKSRLPYYYHFLRDKKQLPVLPVVMYLKVGLDGIGIDTCVEKVDDFEVNRFRYLYVGLPGLDGVQYMQGDNWLGVALSALMKIPPERVAWLGAEALRKLAEAPISDQKRYRLAECVQAYLPMDAKQKQEFKELLETESYAGVKAMNKTVYEAGMERMGIRIAIELLEDHFGLVTAEVRDHLERMSVDELSQLARKIPKAKSLAELGLPGSSAGE
jgi:hypothetical protein